VLVGDSEDQNGIEFNRVDDFKRKTVGQASAAVGGYFSPAIRVFKNAYDRLVDFEKKISSKPLLAELLIIDRIVQVLLCLGEETIGHLLRRLWILLKTSSPGTA